MFHSVCSSSKDTLSCSIRSVVPVRTRCHAMYLVSYILHISPWNSHNSPAANTSATGSAAIHRQPTPVPRGQQQFTGSPHQCHGVSSNSPAAHTSATGSAAIHRQPTPVPRGQQQFTGSPHQCHGVSSNSPAAHTSAMGSAATSWFLYIHTGAELAIHLSNGHQTFKHPQ